MMKGLVVDENMSNLTSASSEISASSGTRNDTAHASLYPQHSSTSTNQEPQPKKKRNLPGNPDPEAEVIALSPKSLLATNRFICEICNKGFQRDQNLQLHRRGHNLPWKLKQRSSKEIRKKVYVCPETTCVHHDPSRALGDLTGIKKHFCRKHGEKKWKCDKCSKRYAVQSDWKAHSKICGTKEYKCDCGTLFSRRDSFVTHRAFCDALAQENGRAITAANPLLSSQTQLQYNLPVKKEIPPWLACPPVGEGASALRPLDLSSSFLPGPVHLDQSLIHNENPHPTTSLPSSYMSATALLHKASQIGVTANKFRPHQQIHMPECTTGYASSSMPSSSSRDQMGTGFAHALASYGNKAGITSDYLEEGSPLFHDISATGFEDALRGMLNPTSDRNFQELAVSKSSEPQFTKTNAGGASDELTRDFLGLKAFSQTHFFNISGLDHLGSSSYGKQNQNQTPWQG